MTKARAPYNTWIKFGNKIPNVQKNVIAKAMDLLTPLLISKLSNIKITRTFKHAGRW